MSKAGQALRRLLASRLVKRGAAIFAVGFAAKLVVFGKEVVVAAKLGVSSDLDAFVIAITSLAFVVFFLLDALGTATTPMLVRLRARRSRHKNDAFSAICVLAVGVLVVTTLLLLIGAPWLLRLVAPGFSRSRIGFTSDLVRWLLPFLWAYGAALLVGAYLNAHDDNLPVATYLALPAAATVLSFVLMPIDRTVYHLVIGSNVGMMLAAAWLLHRAKRHGVSFTWTARHNRLTRHVVGQWMPLVLSALLTTANMLIDRAMASTLGDGSVAALQYGSKASGAFDNLALTSISLLFLPHFSHLIAGKEYGRLRSTFIRSGMVIFGAAVAVSIVVMLFAAPLTRLLFERGEFTADDTRQVAALLRGYMLGLAFHLSGVLAVRLLSALRLNRHIAAYAVVSVTANVLLNLLCMRMWGLTGLAVATSIVYVLMWMLLWWTALRRIPATYFRGGNDP